MMSKKLYNELIQLLYIQSHTLNEKRMVIYIIDQLKLLGLTYQIDAIGNIIVTKSSGNKSTYPCVVSHMDTVHKIVDNYCVYKTILKNDIKLYAGIKENEKMIKTTGIGGDDKCGIFACLYFLKTLPDIKVVFFTQEESGCNGSKNINKAFFDNTRYIIQLDRRGAHDFIDKQWGVKTVSQYFLSEIGHLRKQFKFKSTQGTITDAIKLWENGIGISCLNLSSGYYKQHSNKEYIMVEELWDSILFTKAMIKTLKDKRYTCTKPETPVFNSYTFIKTNIRTKKFCYKCKTMREYGTYIKGKWECYKCLHGKNICDCCYNSVSSPNDLTYVPEYGEKWCSKCIKPPKTNISTDVCSVCKREIDTDVMTYHEIKELDGELEVEKKIGVCLDCCSENGCIPNLFSCQCDLCKKEFPIEDIQVMGRDTYVCPKCFVIATGKKA